MKKAFKIIALVIVLLFISVVDAFAIESGASDARLLFFSRTVVNNSGVMIELSQRKELSETDFTSSFSPTSNDNLSLFRLRDNLFTGQDKLYTDSYRASSPDGSYSGRNNLRSIIHSIGNNHYVFYDGNYSTNSTIVTIKTDGFFSNENNPTMTRRFTLQCFCVEQTLVGNAYNEGSKYEIALGTSSSDTTTFDKPDGSGATTYFYKEGNTYKLFIPSTPYYVVQRYNPAVYYPQYSRHFDICIKLEDDNTDLEPGYYTTSFTVTSDVYREYEVTLDTITIYPDAKPSISEQFSVRGYVGYEPYVSSQNTSFSILSAKDTYTMDLEKTNVYYDVAGLSFYSINLLPRKLVESPTGTKPSEPTYSSWYRKWRFNNKSYNSEAEAYAAYNAALATWESNNSAYLNDQGRATKYTIYLSPTNDYTQSGTYRFIKSNTEGQTRTASNTINYDLYMTDTGGRFSTQSNLPSTTYVIRPDYEYKWISQGNDTIGIQTETRETWMLDQHVFLKVNDNDEHEKGMYYSNIYITLVTNDSITND